MTGQYAESLLVDFSQSERELLRAKPGELTDLEKQKRRKLQNRIASVNSRNKKESNLKESTTKQLELAQQVKLQRAANIALRHQMNELIEVLLRCDAFVDPKGNPFLDVNGPSNLSSMISLATIGLKPELIDGIDFIHDFEDFLLEEDDEVNGNHVENHHADVLGDSNRNGVATEDAVLEAGPNTRRRTRQQAGILQREQQFRNVSARSARLSSARRQYPSDSDHDIISDSPLKPKQQQPSPVLTQKNRNHHVYIQVEEGSDYDTDYMTSGPSSAQLSPALSSRSNHQSNQDDEYHPNQFVSLCNNNDGTTNNTVYGGDDNSTTTTTTITEDGNTQITTITTSYTVITNNNDYLPPPSQTLFGILAAGQSKTAVFE